MPEDDEAKALKAFLDGNGKVEVLGNAEKYGSVHEYAHIDRA